jgi:4-amino-4-deoxy-L-arabinose transferase-like glycosyltransferase
LTEKRRVRVNLKLFIILFIAIVVRVACFLYYHGNSGIRTFEYEEVAVNLIQGKGFTFEFCNIAYRAGIAPVFPALCASVYFVFGRHQSLIVFLQIAFNAATCAMVFFLAKRFFDAKCAYLAAILVALHPGLIIYSSTMLHSLSFYSFLICSAFLMLILSLESRDLRYKILLGICTGFCVLERATFLPFFILAWIWFLYYSSDKREAKKTILISIVSLFLIISPWIIRNAVVLKKVVFIQSNQWAALWLGNNPQSSGTAMTHTGKTWIEIFPEEFRQKLFSLDEIGQQKLFKIAALTFIRQHPAQFIGRTLKKFYYFWWFSPQAGLLYPSSYLIWYKTYYSAVLLGSIIGIIWALYLKKTRPLAILMLLLFSSNSLLHSFYYLEGRHRCSIEPLLLICFSFGLCQMAHYIFSISRSVVKGNTTQIVKK